VIATCGLDEVPGTIVRLALPRRPPVRLRWGRRAGASSRRSRRVRRASRRGRTRAPVRWDPSGNVRDPPATALTVREQTAVSIHVTRIRW